ncbi:hypothetical protein DFH94DRAFT_685120 [Russula ochroleuca]|uniref:Uncharacterized protein n=1 Tax=Russula ochroleuca TaxID=152965 RepID=A0A9P5JXV2_9AGAM|nr:hypothetical protein DFH94DRAFT_685120 [Russula ochroleuca]
MPDSALRSTRNKAQSRLQRAPFKYSNFKGYTAEDNASTMVITQSHPQQLAQRPVLAKAQGHLGVHVSTTDEAGVGLGLSPDNLYNLFLRFVHRSRNEVSPELFHTSRMLRAKEDVKTPEAITSAMDTSSCRSWRRRIDGIVKCSSLVECRSSALVHMYVQLLAKKMVERRPEWRQEGKSEGTQSFTVQGETTAGPIQPRPRVPGGTAGAQLESEVDITNWILQPSAMLRMNCWWPGAETLKR